MMPKQELPMVVGGLDDLRRSTKGGIDPDGRACMFEFFDAPDAVGVHGTTR